MEANKREPTELEELIRIYQRVRSWGDYTLQEWFTYGEDLAALTPSMAATVAVERTKETIERPKEKDAYRNS